MASKKNRNNEVTVSGGIIINGVPLSDYLNNISKASAGNLTTVSSRSRTVINGRVVEESVVTDGKRTVFRNGKPVTVAGYDIDEIRDLEKQAAAEASSPPQKASGITIDMREVNPDEASAAEGIKPLNANTAYRSHLKKLPHIDDARAGKIIEFRAGDGVFASQDQVFELLKLKPHELTALRGLLFVNDAQVKNALEAAAPRAEAAAATKLAAAESPSAETQPQAAPKKGRIIDY